MANPQVHIYIPVFLLHTYIHTYIDTHTHTHTLLMSVLGEFRATRGTHTHTLSQQTAVDLRHHQQGSSDAEPVQAQQSKQRVSVSCTPPRLADASNSKRNVVVEDTCQQLMSIVSSCTAHAVRNATSRSNCGR